MPAIDMAVPMAVSRSPRTDSASFRRMAIIGSIGKSLGTSFTRGGSFTREAFLDVYNFQFGSHSPIAVSPSRDLAHFAVLEDRYCKDFACCGIKLEDLHDLLQHFEECHVRIESDVEDDEDLPFEFESMEETDMDMSDSDSVNSDPNDVFFKAQPHAQRQSHHAVALSDIYSEDYRIVNRSGGHAASAFHTSVLQRKRSAHPLSTRIRKIKPSLREDIVDTPNPTMPLSRDAPTHFAPDGDMDMDIDMTDVSSTLSHGPSSHAYMPSLSQHSHASFSVAPLSQQTLAPTEDRNPFPDQDIAAALDDAGMHPSHVPAIFIEGAPYRPQVAPFDSDPLHPAYPPLDLSAPSQTSAPASEVASPEDPGSVVADASKDDRPWKCKIDGCVKAYKNPGGLKYHMQHGHCEDTGDPEINNIIHKPYMCTVPDCGKRYKNLNGLKYHIDVGETDD
ncbi:hypothetical protein BDK51DRAFT_26267 [Blyttiomyces helicus]|uniref:C2H2-type domain-containing protein n=1 Tax=Blyttiomyces helicus TaxID=388810 RepID=A0A4P9WKS3_9FUNG|nr:hypothetical protein BDK51DRAFT_26267 [Blyttiomyces helicus]|eukprot:RKO93424.1 hypothetical protein BDK51DRAFT_26267 [Blyttiomyces helicus]